LFIQTYHFFISIAVFSFEFESTAFAEICIIHLFAINYTKAAQISNKMSEKIEFQKMAWEAVATGTTQKVHQHNTKTIRMVRFEYPFVEQHWCQKRHVGYVVQGNLKIDFDGSFATYAAGDAFVIEAGATHQHKVIVDEGTFVELFLVEE